MKLKDYVAMLNKYCEEHPEYHDLEVCYYNEYRNLSITGIYHDKDYDIKETEVIPLKGQDLE